METDKTIVLAPVEASSSPIERHSRGTMALAFGVAAVSDVLSIWVTFAPPIEWALDLGPPPSRSS